MKHGVNLGTSYLNRNAGKEFIHYIADSSKKAVSSTVAEAPFFSLLLDSSTDISNVDNELTLVLWCDPNSEDERVHTRVSFLCTEGLERAMADGLFLSLQHALQSLGIEAVSENRCKKLVGIATDGAAANVGSAGGLKGLVEQKLGWIFWMWCLAHRLELSIKDAMSNTTLTLLCI